MPEPSANFYNDSWAQREEHCRANLRRARFAAKQIRQLGQIESILDVGCGVGITVGVLSQNYPRVDGIDTSRDAITRARQRARGHFQLSSLGDWDSKQRYDLILATQLIEHLRQPEDFLREVTRHLRSGGYVVLETPNLNSWKSKSMWRSRIGGMHYGKDHRVVYTLASLTQLLQQNGFEVVKAITVTYSPTIAEELLQPLRNFETWAQKAGSTGRAEKSVQKQQANHERRATSGYSLVSKAARVVHRVFYRAADSPLGDLLLCIPNKLSESRYRGNQAFVVGRLLR